MCCLPATATATVAAAAAAVIVADDLLQLGRVPSRRPLIYLSQ